MLHFSHIMELVRKMAQKPQTEYLKQITVGIWTRMPLIMLSVDHMRIKKYIS